MAYFSQEMKRKVAPQIKAVLKKYGVKASIGVGNYSTLRVTIKEGKIDFQKDANQDSPFHYQINPYHYENHFGGKARKFLIELFAAMKGDIWYDNTDAQIDYFDTAFYTSVNVGVWNKQYEVVA